MSGLYEGLSGAGGLRTEGHSKQNIANYNAEVAEKQAKAEELRANFNQIQQEKEAQRIRGRLSANIGAAGGSGSPVALDIKLEQAKELELENLLIGYEGEVKSQRLKNQAVLDRLQGELYHTAGHNAARAANVGFGIKLASFAMPFLGGLGGASSSLPKVGTVSSSAGAMYARY